MMRRWPVPFAMAVAVALSTPATAQMIPGLQAMVMDVQRQGIMAQVSQHSQEEVDAAMARLERKQQAAPAPVAKAPVSSTYTPSPARRRANVARFIAKSRAADPQGAAAMEALFAQTDVFAAMDRELRPAGLRIDDVADAYAVWWVNAWTAAHGDPRTPDRATMQAVRAQASRAIAAVPDFARADDAGRQELAEALLIQAALIGAVQAEHGANAAMAPKIAAAVKQGARAFGVNLDAMRLTARGFVPAG